MKNYVLISIFCMVLVGLGYFVFVYRPQQIKIECMKIAAYDFKTEGRFENGGFEGKNYSEKVYRDCLGEAGI